MNRNISRDIAVPPVIVESIKGHYNDFFTCRRCGYGVPNNEHIKTKYVNSTKDLEAGWNYCPNCGQKILHAEYAGTNGWTRQNADQAYEEIEKKWEADHPGVSVDDN